MQMTTCPSHLKQKRTSAIRSVGWVLNRLTLAVQEAGIFIATNKNTRDLIRL